MKRYALPAALGILMGFLLMACQAAPAPTGEPSQDNGELIYGEEAVFESIDVVILESFPVRVQATVAGYLMDGCVVLDEVSAGREDHDFILRAVTHRPAGAEECTEALVPFTATVELEVLGLAAGTYTVHAQEQRATFELTVDNVLEEPLIGGQEGPVGSDYGGTVVYLNAMEINLMESFPVQVSVTLAGNLPDGCTTIQSVESTLEGQVFTLLFRTHRPAGAICTQALVPFEETIRLDVYGLPAGEYTVVADDLMETFTLAVDNIP